MRPEEIASTVAECLGGVFRNNATGATSLPQESIDAGPA